MDQEKITPFLWFDDQAEEAAQFYCSIFPDSRIEHVARYGPAGPGREGSVMTVSFRVGGQRFTALNGGPDYHFTPAISFFVSCETQDEIDRYWDRLLEGGKPNRCGWLTDRYGLSWQIVPTRIGELIQHPKAMKVMLEMDKLDIGRLEAAARG
jgi:predicted 3-demethylubiquinone-9 3-methyltransferase (glyoxalase superfamily)